MEFVVGDLVMFSIHDLCMCNNCKFAAHFIGPFKVLKHIGKLAYSTELPPIYSGTSQCIPFVQVEAICPWWW